MSIALPTIETVQLLRGVAIVAAGALVIGANALAKSRPSAKYWNSSLVLVFGLWTAQNFGFLGVGNANLGSVVSLTFAILATGSVWLGFRTENSKSAPVGRVLALAGISALILVLGLIFPILESPVFALLAVAILAALAGRESFQGLMKSNFYGRALGFVMIVTSALTLALLVSFALNLRAVLDTFESDSGMVAAVSQPVVLSVTGALGLISIISIACLVSNANPLKAQKPATRGGLVLNREDFLHLAKDQLGRAEQLETGMALLSVQVKNIREINEVFGRSAGDSTLEDCTVAMRKVLPATALLGRGDKGHFQVLSVTDCLDSTKLLENKLRSAISELVSEEAGGIRLSADFAFADTRVDRYDIGFLAEKSDARLMDSVEESRIV